LDVDQESRGADRSARRQYQAIVFGIMGALAIFAVRHLLELWLGRLDVLYDFLVLVAVLLLFMPLLYIANVMRSLKLLNAGTRISAACLVIYAILGLAADFEFVSDWPILGQGSVSIILRTSLLSVAAVVLIGTLYWSILELSHARVQQEDERIKLIHEIEVRKQAQVALGAYASRMEEHQNLLLEFADLPEFAEGDLDRAAQSLVSKLARVLTVDRVYIWEMCGGNLSNTRIITLYEDGETHIAVEADVDRLPVSATKYELADGKPVILPKANSQAQTHVNDDRCDALSLLHTPIRAAGQTFGGICVESTCELREWRPDEAAVCNNLANQLGQLFLNQEARRQENEVRRIDEVYREAIAAAGAAPYIERYEPHAYMFMGEQIERLTGFTPAEFTPDVLDGMVREYIVRGQAAGFELEEAVDRARRGEFEYWQCDMAIETKSGEIRWISEISVETMGPDGYSVASIGLIIDITDRMLQEKEIRRIEEVYRGAIAAAGAVPYVHSYYPEEKYTFVDARITELTGYPLEQITPAFLTSITIEDTMLGANSGFTIEEATNRSRQGEAPVWLSDAKIRTKDGEIRWLFDASFEMIGTDGRSHGSVGLLMDVTERKRQEEALRNSEARFRGYFENSLIGIVITTEGKDLVLFNDRLCEILGYTREELAKLRWSDITHPEDLPADLSQFQRVIDGEIDGYTMEKRYFRKDGTVVFAEFSGSCIRRSDGTPDHFLAVVQDISERKRAEYERLEMERRLLHTQKLESLGVLAGGIAHDFNNLLTAIVGNLDLALEYLRDSSPAREMVAQAFQASRRASDLTRQMLAYSGKGQFLVSKIDLSALVEENARMLRSAVPRNVILNLDLAPMLPPIDADAGQIQQVVMNLITNAAEAIGERDGVVTLSTGVCFCDEEYLKSSRAEPRPIPGLFAYADVSDSGCGMSVETVARLFDPFFTTKFTGRGLGMSAVLGIVRGHKGAIVVDSRPGSGTQIRVLFSTAEAGQEIAPSAELKPVRARGSTNKNGNGFNVLLVDDEDMVRTLCCHMLEHLGHRVWSAVDGVEAVGLFREHAQEIDCVILDLTMPRMDGETAFHIMRGIRPDVKIILSSGFAEQQASERFAGKGLAGFLQKPFRLSDLELELLRVL
jgi:PAS domain S-box-containing protein